MSSRFLVCEYCPSSTKRKGSSFVGFEYLMNEEITGKKSRSLSTPKDGTRGFIQAVCHSSVLVSYLFLEIQLTEWWSVQLDSYSWRLSQEIPVLRIEEKISDAFQSWYFRVFVLYNSDAGFVAIVKSCRIMFNGVHCRFVDLKRLSYWFRSETPCSWEWKNFRVCNWNLWMMT